MRSASLRFAEVISTGHVAGVAQCLEHGLALHAGQHQVEDHEIARLGVVGGQRGRAVARIGHAVAVALEIQAQQAAQLRLVLDDQDPGGRVMCRILRAHRFRRCEDRWPRSWRDLHRPAPMLAPSIRHHTRGPPMQLTKTLGAAGALLLSALVGGTLIGSALATDESTDTDTDRRRRRTATSSWTRSPPSWARPATSSSPAGKAAANAAVDAALAAGDLTEERADRSPRAHRCGRRHRLRVVRPRLRSRLRRRFDHGSAAASWAVTCSRLLPTRSASRAPSSSTGCDTPGRSRRWPPRSWRRLRRCARPRSSPRCRPTSTRPSPKGSIRRAPTRSIERLTTWLDEGGELGGVPGPDTSVRAEASARGAMTRIG